MLDDKDKSLLKKDVQLNKKDAQLTKKSDKINTLKEYICYMTLQRFGASSEKWSPDQLGLFDEAEILSDEAEILSDEDDTEESTTLVPAHLRKKSASQFPIIYRLPILFMTYRSMKSFARMITKP